MSNLLLAIRLLASGQFLRVWREVHVRIYRPIWECLFWFIYPSRIQGRWPGRGTFEVQTEHRVAFQSPDHLAPKGTATNNSTNKKFVLHMDELCLHMPQHTLNFLDLGCSGGQLVADFKKLKWNAIGLEGSDYSLKHKRAHWATLANKNLLTCDITKPYQVLMDGQPAQFHLITAWEVLEHISPQDLPATFENIIKHLAIGGYFIASTTETSDRQNGIELHQSQWPNAEWRASIEFYLPQLEPVDINLQPHQFVRYNFLNPSFLCYRRKP